MPWPSSLLFQTRHIGIPSGGRQHSARGGAPGDKGGSDIRPVSITDEMKRSYLDYAMSVIVSRALPDVRDGSSPCTGASSSA
jgi:hypothetical protein